MSAAQQHAAEREAKENLLDRQATIIDNQRRMMSSMHKEQQGQVGEAREGRAEPQATGDKTTKQDYPMR